MSLREDLIAINASASATLESCNDMMLGIPAETLAEVPQRIGETISEATNNGYNQGRADGYAHGYDDAFELGRGQGVEQGKEAAYDEFWDNFQLNGTRKDYRSSFGAGWSDITFKPKYDITPVSGEYMFAYSSITDLVAILKRQGVTLDFRLANGNNAFNMFIRESTITTLPVVDITNQGNCNYFFFRGRCLRSIEKLIFNETGTNQNLLTTFQECNELTDVVFEGAIGHDIDMRWSPLSRASIESVVAALGDTASGKTLTLNKAAVNAAFTTEEWDTLVATKPNWTITLA